MLGQHRDECLGQLIGEVEISMSRSDLGDLPSLLLIQFDLCWLRGLSVLKHATQPRQAAQITRGTCCDYLAHPFLNKQ